MSTKSKLINNNQKLNSQVVFMDTKEKFKEEFEKTCNNVLWCNWK